MFQWHYTKWISNCCGRSSSDGVLWSSGSRNFMHQNAFWSGRLQKPFCLWKFAAQNCDWWWFRCEMDTIVQFYGSDFSHEVNNTYQIISCPPEIDLYTALTPGGITWSRNQFFGQTNIESQWKWLARASIPCKLVDNFVEIRLAEEK